MRKCRACGSWTDGDVCDVRCEAELRRAEWAAEDARREDAGLVRCDWCGEAVPAETVQHGYCPTCVPKVARHEQLTQEAIAAGWESGGGR